MIATLPTPSDIRQLDETAKKARRKVIAYCTHPSQATHLAIVEPFAVICPSHRPGGIQVVVEFEVTGPTSRDALLALADELFEAGVDPARLCPECCGQIRWWLGVAS